MSRHRLFRSQLKPFGNKELYVKEFIREASTGPEKRFGDIPFSDLMLNYEALSGEFEYISGGFDSLSSDVSGLSADFYALSTDVLTLTDELSGKIGFDDLIIEKTWEQLMDMKTNSSLVPGQQYRITDYVATVANDPNARSANHPFDLIVVADSESKLNEKARAIRHTGDTYFPASVKFEAWQVWYCLDNDTIRFAWADATNGKGVIYRLIDEWCNDCPYDFKGIQFEAYGDNDDVWRYTFDIGDTMGGADYSLDGVGVTGNFVYGNVIRPLFEYGVRRKLNRIVFKGVNCYFNIFGENCSSNTFGNGCYSNTFGNGCYSNTFGNGCYSNTFGNGCSSNTFGDYCSSNTFGDYCSSNTFGADPSDPAAYYQYITFESGVNTVFLVCTHSSASVYMFQNVTVAKGVANVTISDHNIEQNYKTTYEAAGSQTITLGGNQ